MAAEELRQEQRRLKASKIELAKAEKMAAKFRDNARQLEERLESEVQQSSESELLVGISPSINTPRARTSLVSHLGLHLLASVL